MRLSGAASVTVWRRDDGPVKAPEQYFTKEDLERVLPYVIYTGTGYLATAEVEVEHECDCEYCDYHGTEIEEETMFFTSKEEMKKKLQKEFENDSVSDVQEVFYARAVKQCIADVGLFATKEAGK